MAATSSCSPTSSSYLAILVGHHTDGPLTALETIHEAGSKSHITEAATSAQDASAASALAAVGENDDLAEHERPRQQQQRQRTANGREVAFRVSTPDRIRRRSELLYNEVHAMMKRHDSCTRRERDIQRRDSRYSRVAAAGLTGLDAGRREDASSSRALTVSPSKAPPPPNLYKMFEESLRAHLTEAQQHRTYFPSSSKPTTYSSKDPSTFSYRFQSFDARSSSQ